MLKILNLRDSRYEAGRLLLERPLLGARYESRVRERC